MNRRAFLLGTTAAIATAAVPKLPQDLDWREIYEEWCLPEATLSESALIHETWERAADGSWSRLACELVDGKAKVLSFERGLYTPFIMAGRQTKILDLQLGYSIPVYGDRVALNSMAHPDQTAPGACRTPTAPDTTRGS